MVACRRQAPAPDARSPPSDLRAGALVHGAPGGPWARASRPTRYLHKAFESEPETVTHYIRDRRLERCRLRLLDPRFSQRPISALAFDAGFNDLSGFTRAFKAKYGRSPRQLRATARHTA